MKLPTTLLTAILAIGGCAGSPYQLSKMSREQLSTVSDDQLIRALTNDFSRTDTILQEAKMRKLISDDEVSLIQRKSIKIGMSELALIASWGDPTTVNKSVGSYGTHKQYVYGGYSRYSSPTYVYVENGQVTSWQE